MLWIRTDYKLTWLTTKLTDYKKLIDYKTTQKDYKTDYKKDYKTDYKKDYKTDYKKDLQNWL